MSKVLFKDGLVSFRNGDVTLTDDPAQCDCCDPGTGPCTAVGCVNGFVDGQGNPEPSPLVGCTEDDQGNPQTCLLTLFSPQITYNPPYYSYDPVVQFDQRDPRVNIAESDLRGRTICHDDDRGIGEAYCCSGSYGEQSFVKGEYPTSNILGAGMLGVQFQYFASATTDGRINFVVQYILGTWTPNLGETSADFEPDEFLTVFGELRTTVPKVYSTNDWIPSPPGSGFTSFLTFTMIPIFRPGANGDSQVVGAHVTWNAGFNYIYELYTGSPQQIQWPIQARFTGSATIRLLNLVPYDPNCPENSPISRAITRPNNLDPSVARSIDLQSRGGGCAGCGQ